MYADDESMTPSGTPLGDDISDATSMSYQRKFEHDPYYTNKQQTPKNHNKFEQPESQVVIQDTFSDNASAVRIRDDVSADMTKSLRIQPFGAIKPANLSQYDYSDYSGGPSFQEL